jgi:hypothetical protein
VTPPKSQTGQEAQERKSDSCSFEFLRLPGRHRDAVLRRRGQGGQEGEDVLELLLLEQDAEGGMGEMVRVSNPFGEFGVGIHQALQEIRPVTTNGDPIEDRADVAAFAIHPMARGAQEAVGLLKKVFTAFRDRLPPL